YIAAKASLLAFTKSLSRALAADGILVNAVCPGTTDVEALRGDMERRATERRTSYDEAVEWFVRDVRRIALDRFGRPAEVAEAIVDAPAITVCAFTGYLGGSIVDPAGVDEFLDGVRESLEPARRLGVRDLFISTGQLGPKGEVVHEVAEHPATMWITAYRALS